MNSYISECSLSKAIDSKNKRKFIEDLCNKIEKYDKFIHAFLPEKNRKERVLAEFDNLYKKKSSEKNRLPLFATPIAVKDIFHVDKFTTKAGSNLPEDALQGAESKAVTQLKNAGAIILGKTVTTEFAYYQPGATVNPNNFTHTPGGSSSGSAAAVSAGFAPLSLGTQTIGSVSRPASYCGVIGFKPSYDRISADGVIPFSYSADHIGFFTQDIKGSRQVASILCDKWDADTKIYTDKPILGIPSSQYLNQADKNVISIFNFTKENLKKNGFQVVETNLFDDIKTITKSHKNLIAYEFAQVHKNWYKKYKKNYRKTTLELIEFGMSISIDDFEKTKIAQLILRNKIEEYQKKYGVDLWISPSATSFAPKGIESTGNPAMNLPWTNAGAPTLSIPIMLPKDKLPLGMQFATQYYKDEELYLLVQKVAEYLKLK